MRIFVILLFATCGVLYAAEPDAKKGLKPFQGKWQIAEAEERGEVAPAEKIKNPVTFDGDKMEITGYGGTTIKWTITLRPEKEPAEIDAAYPKDVEKVQVLKGIYKFEDDTLTIALGLDTDSTRPTKFESKGGSKPSLVLVLKKAK